MTPETNNGSNGQVCIHLHDHRGSTFAYGKVNAIFIPTLTGKKILEPFSHLLDRIGNISYGFGTQEEPCPNDFVASQTQNSFQWKQIHGAHCAELLTPEQVPDEADGFFTQVRGLPLKISTADCVPILLAKKDGTRIAALHAGWRGTLKRIVFSLWQSMKDSGSPGDWVAVLGPSIKPCCYEVSSELVAEFSQAFPNYPAEEIFPRERHLDLSTVNRHQLNELGIEEVEVLPVCTFCNDDPKYFSYRRRTKLQTGEAHKCQMSVIMIGRSSFMSDID